MCDLSSVGFGYIVIPDYKNHPKQHGRCFSTHQEPFLPNPQDETKYRQRISVTETNLNDDKLSGTTTESTFVNSAISDIKNYFLQR